MPYHVLPHVLLGPTRRDGVLLRVVMTAVRMLRMMTLLLISRMRIQTRILLLVDVDAHPPPRGHAPAQPPVQLA
jgi:hypothetical protein